MKDLINKITDKDRLVKLYGCSECSTSGFDTHNLALCPKCSSKGYTINQDSQVLDIVRHFSTARLYFKDNTHCSTYGKTELKAMRCDKFNLAQALIKLIELMKYNDSILDERQNSEYDLEMSSIDRDISRIILFVSKNCLRTAFGELLSFCNHHKIDIWQSIADILEGEE